MKMKILVMTIFLLCGIIPVYSQKDENNKLKAHVQEFKIPCPNCSKHVAKQKIPFKEKCPVCNGKKYIKGKVDWQNGWIHVKGFATIRDITYKRYKDAGPFLKKRILRKAYFRVIRGALVVAETNALKIIAEVPVNGSGKVGLVNSMRLLKGVIKWAEEDGKPYWNTKGRPFAIVGVKIPLNSISGVRSRLIPLIIKKRSKRKRYKIIKRARNFRKKDPVEDKEPADKKEPADDKSRQMIKACR